MDQVEELYSDEIYSIYKTSCDCYDTDHDLTFTLEYDEGIKLLIADFKVNGPVPYCYDWDNPWYIKTWNRIKLSWKVLFTGRITYSGSFIFRGEKHIRDLISALYEGLGKLKRENNV